MSETWSDKQRLLASITETDAIIAGADAHSPDPEVREMLAEAYRRRAFAHGALGSHAASITDWDGFLRIWSELHPRPEGHANRLLVEALSFKVQALLRVGANHDAGQLAVEIDERFSATGDTQIQRRLGVVLAQRAGLLLARPAGVAEALAISDRLLARFGDVPADDMVASADLLIHHARQLAGVFGSGYIAALLGAPAEMVVNAGTEGLRWASARVDPRLPVPLLNQLSRALDRRTPTVLHRHRRRLEQALVVLEAVQGRLEPSGAGDEEELGELRRRAELSAACVNWMLGRPFRGAGGGWPAEGGQDPAAVPFFDRMAAEASASAGPLGSLRILAALRMRALALVGDDPRLAGIAYDDSVDRYLPDRRSPLLGLVVRALRPSG